MTIIESLDFMEINILKYIILNEITTYEEISNRFNISISSAKTMIEELSAYLNKNTNSSIEIKPGKGIMFTGDINELNYFTSTNSPVSTKNILKNRVIDVVSRLLQKKDFIKIQDLAEEMFVSRATLENTLKDMRESDLISGLEYISSRNGIKLSGPENIKRKIMNEIISFYWGGIVAVSEGDAYEFDIRFNTTTPNLFDKKIINGVVEIFNNLISKHKLKLSEFEYQSLVIHLAIAVDRIRSGHVIDHRFARQSIESKHVDELVEKIEKEFSIVIPQFEKEYIDIHLVAIENNKDVDIDYKSLDKLEYSEELQLILFETLSSINPDYELMKNLLIHLNAAIKRLKLNLSIKNSYTKKIKESFTRAYYLSVSLGEKLEQTFSIVLNDDELSFITLHIQTHLEKKSLVIPRVVLVCSSGYGTSKFLEQRLLKNFSGKFEVSKTISLTELNSINITEDLIISTIPIDFTTKPVIFVSPLLNEIDVLKIENYVDSLKKSNKDSFLSLLNDELFYFSDKKSQDYEDIIKIMGTKLIKLGKGKSGLIENALNREDISSTSFGRFAMPHCLVDYVNEPSISIFINPHGVEWKGEKVKLIFFFALNESIKEEINEVYKFFNEIVSSEGMLEDMTQIKNFKELMSLLERYEK